MSETGATRVLCLSDLHGDFDRFPPDCLPNADAVLVAGDFTTNGSRYPPLEDEPNARAWVAALGRRYGQVFYILGNHDLDMGPFCFELCEEGIREVYSLEYGQPSPTGARLGRLGPDNVFCWRDLRLTGINLSPCFDAPSMARRWTNMTARRKEDASVFAALPPVDILVSHCPPQGIRDGSGYGSPGLRDYLHRHAPRLIVCGHVHEAAGVAYVEGSGGTVCVVNAAQTAMVVTVPTTGRVEAF